MDRHEVQRLAAEGGRRWRTSLTADEKQAHYQRSAETRRHNRDALAAREVEHRQADAVRHERRLKRAQEPRAITLRQERRLTREERRLEREQQRQASNAAAYIESRTAIFWSYVDVASPDNCWQWLGSVYTGYGSFYWIDSPQGAHRVMWLVTHGPIPSGLVVDHLCERKPCVSPYHLEPVTDSENKARRGVGRPADRRRPATIPEFTSSAYRRQRRGEMLAERAPMNWYPPNFTSTYS